MELFPIPNFGTLRPVAGISLTFMVDGVAAPSLIRQLTWRAADCLLEAICCFWTATWNGESSRTCASEPMAASHISGGNPNWTRHGKSKPNSRSGQDGEQVAQFVSHLRRVVQRLRDFLFHQLAKLPAQPVNRHLHRAL